MSNEELPDVNSLSDEEFDKVMANMTDEPLEEEAAEVEPEAQVEATEEVEEPQEDDTEVEQAEDAEEDESSEPDEETTNTDSEDDTEDSTETETEVSKGYNFAEIPMDELLPMEIAANGTKVKATLNELITGFQKGMNYTQKLQELAPLKKSLSIVSSNGLTEEDLNLLVEAKNGSKEAYAKLMSNSNVDPLDVDTDEHKSYTPADFSKEEVDVDMDMVRQEILADEVNSEIVQSAIKTMPQDMYDVVSESSGNLKSLHSDVKAGIYQEVMPEVMKLQTLYGKTESTMQTYIKVANKRQAELEQSNQQETTVRAVRAQERSNQRSKVAKTTKSPKKESVLTKDISSLSDDEFDAEFQKIMGRSVSDYK